MIKRLRVQQPNKLLLAEIYYFTGDYEQAKSVLSAVVQLSSFESVKCSTFRNRIKHKFSAATSEVKYVELGCYVLYQTGEWKAAIDYFKWLMVNKKENVRLWNLLSAHCYKELGDLQTSITLLDEVRLSRIYC